MVSEPFVNCNINVIHITVEYIISNQFDNELHEEVCQKLKIYILYR